MLFISKKITLVALLSSFFFLISCGGESDGPSNNIAPVGNSLPQTLSAPNVATRIERQQIIINWDDSHADSYRVLYWQSNEAPREFTLSSLSYRTPTLSVGQYNVLIEAYDALGNSLFSPPFIVEVL